MPAYLHIYIYILFLVYSTLFYSFYYYFVIIILIILIGYIYVYQYSTHEIYKEILVHMFYRICTIPYIRNITYDIQRTIYNM